MFADFVDLAFFAAAKVNTPKEVMFWEIGFTPPGTDAVCYLSSNRNLKMNMR